MANAVIMRVKFEGSPELADKMLHEVVVPNAKAQAGFQSGTWMHDGVGNGMAVIVFATAEDATAAQEALKPPPGGPQVQSSDVWVVGAHA